MDAIELCKALKIQKVILNGWSFGGTVAQKTAELAAELAPGLVQKLILTASVSHEGFASRKEEGKVV